MNHGGGGGGKISINTYKNQLIRLKNIGVGRQEEDQHNKIVKSTYESSIHVECTVFSAILVMVQLYMMISDKIIMLL